MSERMHIVLSSDDAYAKYMAVTIASVLFNRAKDDELAFHVLDGGIQPENRQKILEMVTERGADVEFLPVEQSLFSGSLLNITEKNHITPATYYRLLLPSLIHADRCIYMDCDMICRVSLAPLWRMELGESVAAAVKDIDEDKHSVRLGLKRYFNAGMLVVDLSFAQNLNIQKSFFDFLHTHHDRIVMHDQDIINCVLDGKIKEADMRWNVQVAFTHQCKKAGFFDMGKKACILHYIGHKKPWMSGKKVPYQCEYIRYMLDVFDGDHAAVPLRIRIKCKVLEMLNAEKRMLFANETGSRAE